MLVSNIFKYFTSEFFNVFKEASTMLGFINMYTMTNIKQHHSDTRPFKVLHRGREIHQKQDMKKLKIALENKNK